MLASMLINIILSLYKKNNFPINDISVLTVQRSCKIEQCIMLITLLYSFET